MRNEYKLEKKKFIVEEIKQIYMIFDNYDYILIDGNEVKDISLNFCDYLIIEDNKICRVVESGFIKLQLSDKFRKNSYDAVVYNPKEYNVDKNQYVENRLCENRIKSLRVHDNNYWHDSILGNMQAEIKEGFIITRVNRTSVTSVQELYQTLSTLSGGVLIEGVYPNGLVAYYAIGI